MSAETSSDTEGGVVSFTEEVTDDCVEETKERRSVNNKIRICNGTDTVVYVELDPIDTVRRNKARQKKFGLGANVSALEGGGGANVQVQI